MSESSLWRTFVNFFLGRSLIWQGISFQSFTPKRDKEFLCISSFELLTWKLPEVDDLVCYEWIVEFFSNKLKRFVGELLLLTSCIRLTTVLQYINDTGNMSASLNKGIACSRISEKYINCKALSSGELEFYWGSLGCLTPGSKTIV